MITYLNVFIKDVDSCHPKLPICTPHWALLMTDVTLGRGRGLCSVCRLQTLHLTPSGGTNCESCWPCPVSTVLIAGTDWQAGN